LSGFQRDFPDVLSYSNKNLIISKYVALVISTSKRPYFPFSANPTADTYSPNQYSKKFIDFNPLNQCLFLDPFVSEIKTKKLLTFLAKP
jgi:hypothetical protein